MTDKLTQILAECLEAVEAGRLTPAECLAQYPEYRSELGDLLQIATDIRSTPVVHPSPEVRRAFSFLRQR